MINGGRGEVGAGGITGSLRAKLMGRGMAQLRAHIGHTVSGGQRGRMVVMMAGVHASRAGVRNQEVSERSHRN